MKYSEYRSKSKFKGSAAFYIIIACCLLSIGGAAWFAASTIKERGIKEQNSSQSEYTPPPSSTIEMPQSSVLEDVGQSITDEPYSSETVSSKATESTVEKPVFTLPVQGEIIKDYNERTLQYSATFGDMRIHTAIDIACEDGTSVSAAANGKVISVEDNPSLGKVVTIDHGNEISAKYAAIKDPKVKAGDSISAGDIIGTVTTIPSECADQSHLHLEVYKNGHIASPLSVLGLN